MLRILNLAIIFFLAACSAKPYVVYEPKKLFSVSSQKILVVSHGWHTGFVVPSEHILSLLPALKERFKTAPYIEFGWGDSGFYQAKEITSGLTIQAIFWPTDSVIHAVGLDRDAKQHFPKSRIETLCLKSYEYSLLITFIANSFYTNQDGDIISLKKGLYGDSQFYQGVGGFYLMNTCNKWTAKGLKSARLDISTLFKLSASSVMDAIADLQNEMDTGSSQDCL